MRRAFSLLWVAAGLAGCAQDLDDAVVPIDRLAADYARAVCENLDGCCEEDFDADDCTLAGQASAQRAIEALQSMAGAVYRSDRAVQCLQRTESSASYCRADFASDCAGVFENVRPTADAGSSDLEAQCEGQLF